MDRVDGVLLPELDGSEPSKALPRALGGLSLALGVGALAEPGPLARLTGVDDDPASWAVIRGVGARELGHAAGLLAGAAPAAWAWTRVAGDAMDLALLGRAWPTACGERRAARRAGHRRDRRHHRRRPGRRGRRRASPPARGPHDPDQRRGDRQPVARGGVPVLARPREPAPVHVAPGVGAGDGDLRRSHWTARGPGRPADRVGGRDRRRPARTGRSPGGRCPARRVPNAGRVRFAPAPGGRGTEVRVRARLRAARPARSAGRWPSSSARNPSSRSATTCAGSSRCMETGEVVRSEGSPNGISARQQVMQRPAAAAAGDHPPLTARDARERTDHEGQLLDGHRTASGGATSPTRRS